MGKKEEKVERVLATGAKGDPNNPTLGAPAGAFDEEQITPPPPAPVVIPAQEVHTQAKKEDDK